MNDAPDGRAAWVDPPDAEYQSAHPGWDRPAPDPTKPARRLQCVAMPAIPINKIPPRPWAYGHYLLFGKAALLAAVDGGGKGFMATAMILSLITGRPLLNEKVWRQGPVCIVTYEDDVTEWQRRIAAACIHYGVNYEFALQNIRFLQRAEDVGGKICFAEIVDGKVTCLDRDDMVHFLKEMGAVALVIDPFNHAHSMGDGNNNALIAAVAAEIDRICCLSGCAGMVLHHVRKGSVGSVDDIMGATSLRATFRSNRVLAKMTPAEAEKLNIKEDPWRYSQIASIKANFAAPLEKATWFKLVSVHLDNSDELYIDGDSVGVCTTWCPRPLFSGMAADVLTTIFKTLRDTPYSPHKQAKNWAGTVLIEQGGRSESEATAILKQWVKNAVLTVEERWADGKNKTDCLTVNDTEVAKILGNLDMNSPPSDDPE